MYCIECGEKNKAEAKFCYLCGSKLVNNIFSEGTDHHSIKDENLRPEKTVLDNTNIFDYEDISFYRICLIITILLSSSLGLFLDLSHGHFLFKLFIIVLCTLNLILTYILSNQLNKPTWVIIIYSILGLFILLNLIPLIGLLADSNKVLKRIKSI